MKRLFKWRIGIVLVAVLCLGVAQDAQALRLVRYPYIQNVTEDSVVIVWTTDQPGDSVVEYGPTPEYGFTAVGEADTRTHAVVIRNLVPDTLYYYRVRTGSVSSNGDIFKTANSRENPFFKIVVFGDSGDCTIGFPLPPQIALASRIRNLAPDLLIHTGDVVYPNGEQWGYDRCHFPIYRSTMKNVPFFPSPGNHDYRPPSFLEPYLENFYLPENAVNPEHAERYYSFKYGNGLFVALDTELRPGGVANPDQRQWLENELANATDVVWKFVYFHRPPFSSGSSGSSMSVRNVVAPLAERYNVDIVFAGHDHNYERTYPIWNEEASDLGVVYVVTGGGGALLSLVGRSSWTAFSGSFYHVTDVRSENQTLTLEPVEITGRRRDSYRLVKGTLTGTVTNTNGEAIPSATLTVLVNGRQRAVMSSLPDGTFYFYLAEGVYDVSSSAPGCQTQAQTNVQVPGESETAVHFVLQCE